MYIKDEKLITDDNEYSVGDACLFFLENRTVISATIAYIPTTSNVIYVERVDDFVQISLIWLEKLKNVEKE